MEKQQTKLWYARTNIPSGNGKYKSPELGRFIMNVSGPDEIDHRNGNPLDCQKENLRIATRLENSWNRPKQSNNTSGFKGVSSVKRRIGQITSQFRADIQVNKKNWHLGQYKDAESAARAYDAAARRFFGTFARLNFPEVGEVGC